MAEKGGADEYFDLMKKWEAIREEYDPTDPEWQTNRFFEYLDSERDPKVLADAVVDAYQSKEPLPTWLMMEVCAELETRRPDRFRQKEATLNEDFKRAWTVFGLRRNGISATDCFEEASLRQWHLGKPGTFEKAWKRLKDHFPRPWVK